MEHGGISRPRHGFDRVISMAEQHAITRPFDHPGKTLQWAGNPFIVGVRKDPGLGNPCVGPRNVVSLQGLKLNFDNAFRRQAWAGLQQIPCDGGRDHQQ